MRATTWLATALTILAAGTTPARAGAIHKCTMPDGSVAFGEVGCPGGGGLSSRYALPPPAVSSGGKERLQRPDFAEYRQGERFGPGLARPGRYPATPSPTVARRSRAAHPAPATAVPVVATATRPPRSAPLQSTVREHLGMFVAWVRSAGTAPFGAGAADPAPHTDARPTWAVSSATRVAGPRRRLGAEADWD